MFIMKSIEKIIKPYKHLKIKNKTKHAKKHFLNLELSQANTNLCPIRTSLCTYFPNEHANAFQAETQAIINAAPAEEAEVGRGRGAAVVRRYESGRKKNVHQRSWSPTGFTMQPVRCIGNGRTAQSAPSRFFVYAKRFAGRLSFGKRRQYAPVQHTPEERTAHRRYRRFAMSDQNTVLKLSVFLLFFSVLALRDSGIPPIDFVNDFFSHPAKLTPERIRATFHFSIVNRNVQKK